MKLCEVLKQYRWATKVGVRELAAEIGFSAATLSRIENGGTPDGVILSKILCWLLEAEVPEPRVEEVVTG